MIDSKWKLFLKSEFESDYMRSLSNFLAERRRMIGVKVLPSKENVFTAFNQCPFDKLKAVMVDSHISIFPERSEGLAFSTKDNFEPNETSRLFSDKIEEEIYNGLNVNKSYDLSHLSAQGVLLLNSVLTADVNKTPHFNKGWETFTESVVKKIDAEIPDVTFVFSEDTAYLLNYVTNNQKFILTKKSPIFKKVKELTKINL